MDAGATTLNGTCGYPDCKETAETVAVCFHEKIGERDFHGACLIHETDLLKTCTEWKEQNEIVDFVFFYKQAHCDSCSDKPTEIWFVKDARGELRKHQFCTAHGETMERAISQLMKEMSEKGEGIGVKLPSNEVKKSDEDLLGGR